MKSIIQDEKNCFLCGSPYAEEHHVFYGTANRKLSEQYGLKVWLCPTHHRHSKFGVHFNKKLDEELKAIAEKRFKETYKLNFERLFRGDGLEEWIQ